MKKEIEVVCALIKKDNKYFACQRGNKGECCYKWEFPGGKIEPGETNEQAIIREIYEELKTVIHVDKYITTIKHEYNTFIITMHAYLCHVITGNLELSEHINSKWLSLEEMKDIDIAEADKLILKNSILFVR